MEQVIFGFANLIYLCFFLALSALPFYVANRLGSLIDTRFKSFRFRFLFPALLLLALAGWGGATYFVFKRDCGLVPKTTNASTKPPRPEGFSFYNYSTFQPAAGYRWTSAIEQGYFRYVDYWYPESPPQSKRVTRLDDSMNGGGIQQRLCAGKILSENPKRIDAGYSCDAFKTIPKAEAIVQILPERKSEYWWHPPIYKLEIQVKDRPNGNLIANATDLVIGGGLVGTILRFIGGDQDYGFLSCSYASANIGPWRPSLTSRPRFTQYETADTDFVVHSFAEK